MANSIGLIESKGLVALIEAADVILKNSPVKILGIHKLENGLVSLAVSGQSDYVKAAVDAGTEAGKRVGEIYSSSVVDSPTKELLKLFDELFSGVKVESEIKSVDVISINAQTEQKFSEEILNGIVNFKPILKSESKREKSKPLLVTKVDHILKIKKHDENKSVKIKPSSERLDKKIVEELRPEIKTVPEKDVKKSLSTIERLRLEALGMKKKSIKEAKHLKKQEDPVEEVNKINLALETKDIDFNAIDEMNVHKLRNYARKFPDFPIKGREISRANRDELVKLFKNLSSN
jgi:microcompartment protein CcmL/EutN